MFMSPGINSNILFDICSGIDVLQKTHVYRAPSIDPNVVCSPITPV